MRDVRSLASSTLLALGVASITLGLVLAEARHTLLTPDGLARRAGAALADPRVSAFVADRATSAVLAEQPDLTAFRPVIAAVASTTVSSQAFRRAAQAGLRSTAAAVLSEEGGRVAMSIPDLGILLRSAVAQANPTLAERIPARVRGVVAQIGQGKTATTLIAVVRLSRRIVPFVVLLFAMGAACLVAGFALARDRRRALFEASLDLVAAAIVVLVLRAAGGWFVQSATEDGLARAALAGTWAALTGGIRAWALSLALVGLVIAAAAQSLLERLSIAGALARAWRLLEDPPGGAWGRLATSAVLIAVGAAVVINPGAAVQWIVIVVGAVCVFVGVRQALTLLMDRLGAKKEPATRVGAADLRRLVIVYLVTMILAAGAFALTRPPAADVRQPAGVCNGSAALCDRPLNEVTFAGAHNAMSAADVPGWMFPQHERGLAGQLTDGIRAFLIDVHYGRPAGSQVVTDLDVEAAWREKIERAVGPDGMSAALRIRDRLMGGGDLGARGLYLCHGFCELGAQPFESWLATLADFLVQHPDEVVLLVIEDYVTPSDLAAALEKAGFGDLVYRGAAQPPWPTLRTMIDTRQRVVVMTESGRPGVGWILPAFQVMQETPYTFHNPAQMTCTSNRGGTSGSLFQINNWIETAPASKPSNAALVNAYDTLMARVRQCEQERGLKPTIVAVDFYRTGDVLGVVRALNR